MKEKDIKKYIILITYAMLLAFVLLNIKDIFNILGSILKILTPLWIGIAFAFTLNVPMTPIEDKIFKKKTKSSRILSLILSILIVLILLLVLFVWIIPDFIESASYFISQIPDILESLNDFLIKAFKNTDLSQYLLSFSGSSDVSSVISNVIRMLISNFTSVLTNLANLVINLVTGIIISVYFLLEKEHIIEVMHDILEKLFNKKLAKKVKDIFALANKSFHDFIMYQCLECLILGIMMFIAFVIFRFPYALSLAFLTAVTAIIPMLGATVACIIGAICIGTVSVEQAIVFLIVFQVIQQIEGNIIYPKVVGKHVGLPPVITIIAIMVGAKLGGFLGMLVCIPITAILYSLFWNKINEKKLQ